MTSRPLVEFSSWQQASNDSREDVSDSRHAASYDSGYALFLGLEYFHHTDCRGVTGYCKITNMCIFKMIGEIDI